MVGVGMDEAQQPSLGQEPAAKKKKTTKGIGDGAWAKKEANKTSNAAGTVSLKAEPQPWNSRRYL